jgi:uncharacterized membrane protein
MIILIIGIILLVIGIYLVRFKSNKDYGVDFFMVGLVLILFYLSIKVFIFGLNM